VSTARGPSNSRPIGHGQAAGGRGSVQNGRPSSTRGSGSCREAETSRGARSGDRGRGYCASQV
jgi:hypothetical protein